MLSLFRETNVACSQLVTKQYSTSFSMGILAFDKDLRNHIYAIYGFVRYADEIVDTFFDFDQEVLFNEFKEDTYKAIERNISLNPILDAFQAVVHQFNIDKALIEAFLNSMAMDLHHVDYQSDNYKEYIYGSAEVVGLMCLKVFCQNNNQQYADLKDSARSLGAAFQKVNFLRDIKDDYITRGRTYFPEVNLGNDFDIHTKRAIEKDIQKDFDEAYVGIIKLPKNSRDGVLLAYRFYLNLFNKIRKTEPKDILEKRIRVSNLKKILLATGTIVNQKLSISLF